MKLRDFNTVQDRRNAVENETGVVLKHIGAFTLDEAQASSKHCENMIGAVQIPIGIAGPLALNIQNSTFKFQNQHMYLPLATTEGALIASINRGCKAVSTAGGCDVVVEDVGTTRGPVFVANSLQEAHSFTTWLKENIVLINQKAQETSAHIRLRNIKTDVIGTYIYVRFSFHTGDAMGMNMVTIATQQIVDWISTVSTVQCVAVSGNACIDKKPAWVNTILGRGVRAWSEAVLTTTVIADTLKTSKQALLQTWEAKCLLGSAVSGSIGYNGHAANIIAALFIATGQDPAHVVEGSQAITTMKQENEGIRVSVYLPSLMVGTVGGGTALATQQEALALLGCAGGDDGAQKAKLAGIVAAAVLAGEISELAALASGTLTQAHKQLGR